MCVPLNYFDPWFGADLNSKAMINRIESPSLEEFVACVAILNNSRDAFEELFS